MNVIPPLVETFAEMAALVTSSTVAEPDLSATPAEAAWNAATNYTLGTVVIRTTTHKKYTNIQAGVDATLPEVDAALDTPTRWVETGVTNKYAMFDTLRNTETTTASPLTVVITPGERVNAIGVFAMSAESITISMTSGGNPVYSYTENLNAREVLDWYDYFFEPFSTIPSIVRFDLPPYSDGIITITLTSTTGTVSCGAVVVGNYVNIGQIQYNALSDEQNFSRIEREFDGTALITQRRSIPKVNCQVFSDKTTTNRIRNLRRSLNAIPAVWSGLDDLNTDDYFEAVLILGVYRRFEIDVAHTDATRINLELEEL